MVHPEGFEPPTLGSEDRCSIQLSYRCTQYFDYKSAFLKLQETLLDPIYFPLILSEISILFVAKCFTTN